MSPAFVQLTAIACEHIAVWSLAKGFQPQSILVEMLTTALPHAKLEVVNLRWEK